MDPSLQSARFGAMIHAAKAGDERAHSELCKLGIQSVGIQQVIRLSVTLEDFSVLCSAERQLKGLGWIPSDHHLVPTLPIADLLCVARILEDDPIVLIHYLDRRTDFQKWRRMRGDELDFLGWYLAKGFGVDGVPGKEDDIVVFTGMSEPIDAYFNRREYGFDLPKPRPNLAPLFREILDKLNRKRPPHWIHVGCLLLSYGGFSDQKAVTRELNTLRERVKRLSRRNKHKGDIPVMLTEFLPRDHDRSVVMFCVFAATHRKESRECMHRRASEIVDELPQGTLCCMFARCVDDWREPYEAFLIAKAPDIASKPILELHHLAEDYRS